MFNPLRRRRRPLLDDNMYNAIRHLEERAIECEADEECDCLLTIIVAIEQAYGIDLIELGRRT